MMLQWLYVTENSLCSQGITFSIFAVLILQCVVLERRIKLLSFIVIFVVFISLFLVITWDVQYVYQIRSVYSIYVSEIGGGGVLHSKSEWHNPDHAPVLTPNIENLCSPSDLFVQRQNIFLRLESPIPDFLDIILRLWGFSDD